MLYHSSHSCFLISLSTLLCSFFFVYLVCFLCFLFLPFFYVSCCSSLLLFTVHDKGFFILSAMIRFTVLPLKYFWPIVGIFLGLPISLLAAQPPPLPCAGYAMFHSQTKRVLFYFLAFRGIPIRIRAVYSLLLTPIALT